jgi:hypothetical protein
VEWNGLPYIEMERIDGSSLQQILKTSGQLPPAVALAVMILICRALNYAHQEEFNLYGSKRKGVIHCDIKPANIMITRAGTVKLMDFGIANPTNVSLHTDPDKVTGSLQYMAPEQIKSHQVDARTDIFAIGVVFYEMLSGKKVFPSKQLKEVIEKRKTNDYLPLSQVCPNLPKRLYRVVQTSMELLPENRYQTAADLLKQLVSIYRTFTDDDPQVLIQRFIETGAVATRKIRISRQMSITAAAAVVPTVVLIIVIAVMIFGPHRNNPPLPQPAATTIPPKDPLPANPPAQEQTAVPAEPSFEIAGRPDTLSTPALPTPSVTLPQPARTRVIAPPVVVKKITTADPVTALQALVDGGNLDAALKECEERSINDGGYYAIYARCLYEKGMWKKACEMAEKSTKVPSVKVSESSRKGQYLLYTAKYLSSQYDAAPGRETASAAIDAWWKVREHFEGTAEGAKAAFADSEIGRISKTLNN